MVILTTKNTYSRGSIYLEKGEWKVDLGFLSDEGGKDLINLANGIQKIKDFMKGLYLYNSVSLNNEEDTKEFVRNNCVTTFHLCGSCRMARSAWEGVVDLDLKVFGSQNLYICDSSVFPSGISSSFWKVVFCVGLIAFDKNEEI